MSPAHLINNFTGKQYSPCYRVVVVKYSLCFILLQRHYIKAFLKVNWVEQVCLHWSLINTIGFYSSWCFNIRNKIVYRSWWNDKSYLSCCLSLPRYLNRSYLFWFISWDIHLTFVLPNLNPHKKRYVIKACSLKLFLFSRIYLRTSFIDNFPTLPPMIVVY